MSKASLYYFQNKTMIDEIICLIVSLFNYISSNDIDIIEVYKSSIETIPNS